MVKCFLYFAYQVLCSKNSDTFVLSNPIRFLILGSMWLMKYDLVVQIWCFELEESIIWSYLCWFYTCNWVSFIFWSSFCVDYFWSFELTVVCETLKILYTYKHTRRTFCTESIWAFVPFIQCEIESTWPCMYSYLANHWH